MFRTPLQERAMNAIFSKDKAVVEAAKEILLDDADRMMKAHIGALPYNLALATLADMPRLVIEKDKPIKQD